jgi:hypothetical protein
MRVMEAIVGHGLRGFEVEYAEEEMTLYLD